VSQDAGPTFRLRLLGAAVGAAVGSALVFLLQHFVFHDDEGWFGVAVFFVVLLVIYFAAPVLGPPIRRFFGAGNR
jgi:uncharacterized membrane protein